MNTAYGKSYSISSPTIALLLALFAIIPAFLVLPVQASAATASLSSTSFPNGSTVTLSGSGFSGTLSFTVDGSSSYITPTTATLTSGAFSTSVTIGAPGLSTLAAGTHTLTVSDTAGDIVPVSFTITVPSTSISPSSGAAGTPVMISGSGYVVSSTIYTLTGFGLSSLYYAGPAGGLAYTASWPTSFYSTVFSTGVISSSGTFSGSITVPQLPGPSSTATTDALASTTVTAEDFHGNIGSNPGATFTYTAPTVSTSLSTGLNGGQAIVITGSGFSPTPTTFTASFINAAGTSSTAVSFVGVTSPVTTEYGTLAAVVQVPQLASGTYTLRIVDGFNNVGTASITVGSSVEVELGSYLSVATPTAGLVTSSGTNVAPSSVYGTGGGVGLGFQVTGAGFPTATYSSPVSASLSLSSNLATAGIAAGTLFCVSGCTATASPGGLSFSITASTIFVVAGALGTSSTSGNGLPVGSYTVTATAGSSTASASFQGISGTLFTVSLGGEGETSASGPSGSTAQVRYYPQQTSKGAQVLIDGVTVYTASAATGATTWPATATFTFTMPNEAVGTHSVQVSGTEDSIGTTDSNLVQFTITTSTPSLTAYPTAGAAIGNTATFIGSGFSPNIASTTSIGSVTYGGATVTGASATLITTTVFSTTSGGSPTGWLIGTFTVPSAAAASATLSVQDRSTPPLNTGSATFTVLAPSITLSATSGVLSGSYTITGSGFVETPASTGGAAITITFGGSTLQPVAGRQNLFTGGFRTTSAGTFLGATTMSPLAYVTGTAGVAGAQTVKITDGSNTYSATFTVKPEISLSPSSGPAGLTGVAVSGDGFAASSALSATFGGSALSLSSGATSGSGGSVSGVTFTVPSSSSAGAYSVVVTDASGNSAPATFTVLSPASITLSPSTGPFGTSVSLSGSGFTAGNTISAKFDGTAITLTGTTTVQTAGVLATTSPPTLTIPSTAAATTHTISVTDGVSTTTAIFTVIPTSVSVSPTTAAWGSTVTITATGYTGAISATASSLSVGSCSTCTGPQLGGDSVTTATASDTTTFTLLSRPYGTYTLTYSDGTHSASTSLVATPGASLSASSALKTVSVTLTGGGFSASTTFTATLSGYGTLTTSTTKTDATGSISATFTVPVTATTGAQTVTVTDFSGHSAPAVTFTVGAPAITLSSTSGAAGTSVQVTGTGFANSANIVITFTQGSSTSIMTTTPTTVSSSTSGAFVAWVTIPSSATSGSATITATDANNNIATATFTVPSVTGLSTSTFTESTAATETTLGVFKTISASFTNSYTSSVTVVMFAVLSSSSGTYVLSGSVPIAAGTTGIVYDVLSGVPTGTYTVSVTLVASNGVTVSSTYTNTITVS